MGIVTDLVAFDPSTRDVVLAVVVGWLSGAPCGAAFIIWYTRRHE